MMTDQEIIYALRCSASVGCDCLCEKCPFYVQEEIPEELRDKLDGRETWDNCDVDGIALAAADRLEELFDAAMREQETVTKCNGWIGVNEKPMPEGNEEYEVCCDYHGEKRIEIHKGWNTHCVTHWRPLPEPPKEGAE